MVWHMLAEQALFSVVHGRSRVQGGAVRGLSQADRGALKVLPDIMRVLQSDPLALIDHHNCYSHPVRYCSAEWLVSPFVEDCLR